MASSTLQGLSSIMLNNSAAHSKWRAKPYQSWRDTCPFLMPYDMSISGAVDSHLACERRDFSSKQSFRSLMDGKLVQVSALTFHITFYEVYLHSSESSQDLWKVGKLYNDPKGRWFRECACTVSLYSSLDSNFPCRDSESDVRNLDICETEPSTKNRYSPKALPTSILDNFEFDT